VFRLSSTGRIRLRKKPCSTCRFKRLTFFRRYPRSSDNSLPEDRVYDGISFLNDLTGQPSRIPANRILYYYNCSNLQAVSSGPWKLHLPRPKAAVPWWDPVRQFNDRKDPALYDLVSEPAERTNLAASNPKTVGRLHAAAERFRVELGEFGRPGTGQRATGSIFSNVPILTARKWRDSDREAKSRAAAEKTKRSAKLKPTK
jgi:hypothetical protein